MARYIVKKVSDFPFPAAKSLTFFILHQNSQGPNFSEQPKKGIGMSVDTDKGIDDLPPDADTIRDPTYTLFSC
jgi:hypothetical protein